MPVMPKYLSCSLVMLALLAPSATTLAAPASETSVARLLKAIGADQVPADAVREFDSAQTILAEGVVRGTSAADAARVQAWKKDAQAALAELKGRHFSAATWGAELNQLYRAEWSEEEVADLLKFYESPVGKKAVRSLPLLQIRAQKLLADKTRTALLEIGQQYYALRAKHWPGGAPNPPGFRAEPQSKPKPPKKTGAN